MTKLRFDPPKQDLTDQWFQQLYNRIKPGPFMIKAYTVATLPSANEWSDNSTFSSFVYVTDETGGAIPAFSDGTNWRRVTDRTIVS